jgi:hypothetical protein
LTQHSLRPICSVAALYLVALYFVAFIREIVQLIHALLLVVYNGRGLTKTLLKLYFFRMQFLNNFLVTPLIILSLVGCTKRLIWKISVGVLNYAFLSLKLFFIYISIKCPSICIYFKLIPKFPLLELISAHQLNLFRQLSDVSRKSR